MKETNKIRLFWLILGVLVTLCVGVLTYHPTTVKEVVKTKFQTDTIVSYVERVDTVFKPRPVTTEIVRVDTVRADTVLVYESKRYNVPVVSDSINGEIEAVVSGVDANLDTINWRLNIPLRTVTNTIETEKVISKKTHLNWGVTVGAGYGLTTRKPDVFVGFGVMYSF
ncbi:MAG: hypothetical protein HDS66_00010 [Bacteroidales bacterium]|nr:hypothetical protein [Bacteroidales bacterium]